MSPVDSSLPLPPAAPPSAPLADATDIVLLVDDVPDNLAPLHDALDESGYTVLVATSGEAALALAAQAPPDIVLLDAVMPGLHGFEVARRLKAHPATAAAPIIFMTGLTETEHVIRGFDAGGVDYVTKPIDPDALIARIRSHLANARRMTSTRAALDAAGRALVAVDGSGVVVWHTPKAASFIDATSLDENRTLPAAIARWLGAVSRGAEVRPSGWPEERPRYTLSSLGDAGGGQLLRAVEEADDTGALESLGKRFQLTEREAEVLLWVSRGKSSRDIGAILGSSPRTVDKHLERVFVKLGVENRAAAASVVTKLLSSR